MSDSDLKMPFILFIVGGALFFLGLYSTSTGRAWERYRGWVYRAEKPIRFWWNVAVYYLAGVCLIGYAFYKSCGLSN